MTLSTTPEPTPTRRRGALLAVMCVGMFLIQFDVTVVNVALPTIRTDLGAGLAGQQWVVDGYAVVLAALLLTGGTLGDRYGHRRVVLWGLGLFGAASLVCGLAPGIGVLVAGRVVQGLGAALLLPGTLAVITHAFPERAEQSRAIGIWAGVSALALPAGPVLGGLLVSALGWPSVFLVNIPIVAVALPATLRLVGESARHDPPRLDLPGAALAAVTLSATVFAVIEAGSDGFTAPVGVGAGLAVLAGVALGVHLRRSRHPLLPPALLRRPAFVGANVVAACMNAVGIGTVFVVTLYLQSVGHRSALAGGLLMVPLFVPLVALAPVTGRLAARYGPRPPMVAGLVTGAVGAALLWLPTATSGYGRMWPALLLLGIGMGLLTAATVAAAVRAVPAERAGLASAVNNTARQSGGALGIAVFGAITGSPSEPDAFVSGLHTVGLVAAALWLGAAGLTCLTITTRERRDASGVGCARLDGQTVVR